MLVVEPRAPTVGLRTAIDRARTIVEGSHNALELNAVVTYGGING